MSAIPAIVGSPDGRNGTDRTRVVVTGGAGFIGSNLVDALIAQGDVVTVIDAFVRGRTHNLDGALAAGAKVVVADVTDAAAMEKAFAHARPQVVYHLAAHIDVRNSVANPVCDACVNVGGTAAVLEAARAAGAGRVVLASTAAVYGNPVSIPTPEDEAIAPLSPYGAGKAAAEMYMDLFARLYGLSTVSLRMANVYGPRQDPHGEAGVVAIFCGRAAEDRPVTVFGDGRQTRDYVYVEDVTRAFQAAGAGDASGAINVSTGIETELNELIDVLGLQASNAPARQGDARRSTLAPERARELLSWEARTPVREGLERTLQSLRPQPALALAVGAVA
jgi:UDP-glucose 4-epimerase